MYETVVLIGVLLAGGYLLAGVLFAVLVHLLGLADVGAGVGADNVPLRLVLAPGVAIFWPVFLFRLRQGRLGASSALPSVPSARWQWGIVAGSAVFAIAGLAAAMAVRQPPAPPPSRGPVSLPGPDIYLIRRGPGPVIGRIFPSIPANFQRARNIDKKPGLVMTVDDGATVAPTSIYWTPTLDPAQAVPREAVLVATVFGPEGAWFPFTASGQWDSGYWIAYSHVQRKAEVYPRTDTDAS